MVEKRYREKRYRASDLDCSTCLSAIILPVGLLWAWVSGSDSSAMCSGIAASRVLSAMRSNGRARVRSSCAAQGKDAHEP